MMHLSVGIMEKLISIVSVNKYFDRGFSSARVIVDFRANLRRKFLGFFNDPAQGPFDFYEGPAKFREGSDKGRQILSGPPSHFFEKKFERIFEGESLTEPWRERAKQRVFICSMHAYLALEQYRVVHSVKIKQESRGISKSSFVTLQI